MVLTREMLKILEEGIRVNRGINTLLFKDCGIKHKAIQVFASALR